MSRLCGLASTRGICRGRPRLTAALHLLASRMAIICIKDSKGAHLQALLAQLKQAASRPREIEGLDVKGFLMF